MADHPEQPNGQSGWRLKQWQARLIAALLIFGGVLQASQLTWLTFDWPSTTLILVGVLLLFLPLDNLGSVIESLEFGKTKILFRNVKQLDDAVEEAIVEDITLSNLPHRIDNKILEPNYDLALGGWDIPEVPFGKPRSGSLPARSPFRKKDIEDDSDEANVMSSTPPSSTVHPLSPDQQDGLDSESTGHMQSRDSDMQGREFQTQGRNPSLGRAPSKGRAQSLESLDDLRVQSLLQTDKEMALIRVAMEIEHTLARLERSSGGRARTRGIVWNQMIKILEQQGKITPQIAKALIEFRNVRNQLIHPSAGAVPETLVTSAVDSGLKLLRLLSNIADMDEPSSATSDVY